MCRRRLKSDGNRLLHLCNQSFNYCAAGSDLDMNLGTVSLAVSRQPHPGVEIVVDASILRAEALLGVRVGIPAMISINSMPLRCD
jgi:hypothetical protein